MVSKKIVVIVFMVFALILMSGFFILDQRQQALVLQFGEVIKTVEKPGLKYKLPFIQNVMFFDKRLLNVSVDDIEVIASDQKRLIINAFAKYKIVDILKFYQTVKDLNVANARLYSILDSSMRQALGEIALQDMLSDKRIEAMKKIAVLLKEQANYFGVDVIDVRITRADLPAENSIATYNRMITDRQQQAQAFRSEGEKEAVIIVAEANKKSQIIVAEAQRKASEIKGKGDAQATHIYNNAIKRDTDFFIFYRSMQAYKESLTPDNTTVILSPGSGYLNYFNNK